MDPNGAVWMACDKDEERQVMSVMSLKTGLKRMLDFSCPEDVWRWDGLAYVDLSKEQQSRVLELRRQIAAKRDE